jgi:alkyl sulfatase BDS1-like metallo-beta-lactamase superfamily hydrolase
VSTVSLKYFNFLLVFRLPRVDAISATEHFSGRHNVTLDGIDFEFVSTGAHNQFFIWLPKQKILVTPDLFDRDYSRTHYFQAKFNTPEMIKMIELAMTFPAETLVPLHKYPVAGSANIAEYLANFKDAIKFSHDQTIQLMNQGYYPDDMLRILKSPRHLSSFLYSANDSLDWRVRSVFNSYLGWFSGKASELHPMDPAEEADGVMKLVRQDSDVIVKQAEKALDEHDDAWALKLSQYLIDAGRRVKEAMVSSGAICGKGD